MFARRWLIITWDTLRQDIAAIELKSFPPHHETADKGHGCPEFRRIWSSTELNGYVVPYTAQVIVI